MMALKDRLHFLHRVWRYRLRHERHGVALVRGSGLAGLTAVDVGANRGIFSYWMHGAVTARGAGATGRGAGSAGNVVAFEPQPEMAAYVRGVKRAFGLDRLVIENAGLSSSPGTLTLHRDPAQPGGASYDHIEDDPIDEDHADDGGQNLRVGNNRSAALDRLETPVTTLDAYFAEHPPASRVGLIKCDVEGHEPHVFRGAARTITEHRPVMLFESHRAADPANEAFAVLGELGYRGYCFTRRGEQPVERYAELLDGLDDAAKHNFVFRPEAAAVKRAA